MARDVLVLGLVDLPTKLLLMGESVDSTIQQQISQQSTLLESSGLASVVRHEDYGRFPEEVVKQ